MSHMRCDTRDRENEEKREHLDALFPSYEIDEELRSAVAHVEPYRKLAYCSSAGDYTIKSVPDESSLTCAIEELYEDLDISRRSSSSLATIFIFNRRSRYSPSDRASTYALVLYGLDKELRGRPILCIDGAQLVDMGLWGDDELARYVENTEPLYCDSQDIADVIGARFNTSDLSMTPRGNVTCSLPLSDSLKEELEQADRAFDFYMSASHVSYNLEEISYHFRSSSIPRGTYFSPDECDQAMKKLSYGMIGPFFAARPDMSSPTSAFPLSPIAEYMRSHVRFKEIDALYDKLEKESPFIDVPRMVEDLVTIWKAHSDYFPSMFGSDADFIDKLADLGKELGINGCVAAYMAGVPVRDILI